MFRHTETKAIQSVQDKSRITECFNMLKNPVYTNTDNEFVLLESCMPSLQEWTTFTLLIR